MPCAPPTLSLHPSPRPAPSQSLKNLIKYETINIFSHVVISNRIKEHIKNPKKVRVLPTPPRIYPLDAYKAKSFTIYSPIDL